jgi:excisionase family DNA binding protein
MNKNTDDERLWLSPEHFAALIDASPRTVRSWCKRGAIPSIMIGHSIRIPRSALDTLKARAEAHALAKR